MDSATKSSASRAADEEADDELDGFDDFTIASSWEKVIATVEATAREWQAAGAPGLLVSGATPVAGSRSLHRLHKEISFGKKQYVVILFFHAGNEMVAHNEWPMGVHHLQLWFGLRDFVVVAPVNQSGVILESSEATTLLSTVAIALSSCGSDWPAFVPIHDPSRKAYKGIQGTNTSYSISFEADRIDKWVPVRFMHLEGLYELFVAKVAFTAASSAEVPALKVEFTMRLTYRTSSFGFESHEPDGGSQAKAANDVELGNEPLWDEDLPWADWHSVEDPIKGFELVTIWNSRFVDSPIQMAEYENDSTFDADKWFLIPVFNEKKGDQQHDEGFAGPLEDLVKAFYVAGEAQFMDDFTNVLNQDTDLLLETFTVPPANVRDRVLKDLFNEALNPHGYGFSFNTNGISIKGAPHDSLFGRYSLEALRFGTCNIYAISELWLEFVREVRFCWDECQPLPRVSTEEPPDLATCIIHQKLQLLAACIKLKAEETPVQEAVPPPQNVEGKDGLKSKGLKGSETVAAKVDLQGSETPAPKMDLKKSKTLVEGPQTGPSTSTTQVPKESELFHGSVSDFPSKSSQDEMDDLFTPPPESKPVNIKQAHVPTENRPGKESQHLSDDDEPWEPLETVDPPDKKRKEGRQGSAGPVKHMMLLKVEQPLHAPILQRVPIMTEDMLLEREQAIAALSRSPSENVARIRLQTEVLASDMSAFKAANPGGVLEDFVRWHSPRDWIVNEPAEDGQKSGNRDVDDIKWPPKGRLSKRMAGPDNVWSQIWEQVAPEPVFEQKPLFDFWREGEKVMHYLETLRPQQLLAQMLCTNFMASADALRRTRVGEMSRVLSELQELYSSIDVILEPLLRFNRADVPLKEDVESWRTDLLQLCAIFRKVETDVFVAASLFQKLKLVPKVMNNLFNSYLDDGERLTCTPVLSAASEGYWKGGSSSSDNERTLVSDLFPVSNSSHSVGRRMGNYLNGNEPDVREVKFHCYEEDLRKQWSSKKERKLRSKMFSHRMYVCGTSNDLQVALSVVSRD